MTDLLLVEKVAEALWQADSERAAGRRRLISWADENENVCDSWRQLAIAAIATVEAHRDPITVSALYGYEAGLVEGARAQWQPIETAPKDGTRILLGRFTGDPKADSDGLQAVDCYRTIASKSGYIGFGHFSERFWLATHWMPLPPPPSIANDGKEGAG